MTAPLRMELSILEAAHLSDLVGQFVELLAETVDEHFDDPAVARLVPDAYADDTAAADEFRRLTQSDLLDRRRDDAARVLASLERDGVTLRPADIDRVDAEGTLTVHLDGIVAASWLRTLTALRLVLATRLGIVTDDDHDAGDARFGVYDWLGYRLEGLIDALDA